MKLSDMQTQDQAVAEELLRDPAFRAEWDRTALARAVALQVVNYRTEHGMSQRALAEQLGMKQPQVARLESGEHNPTIETLVRLAGELNVEFTLDIHPAGRRPRLLTRRAQQEGLVASFTTGDTEVLLAAG